jgi:hypothetical protein
MAQVSCRKVHVLYFDLSSTPETTVHAQDVGGKTRCRERLIYSRYDFRTGMVADSTDFYSA